MPRVIRLRGTLERLIRNPWIEPLVILLLAVVLMGIAIHEGVDQVFENGVGTCVSLAFIVVAIVVWVRQRLSASMRPEARGDPPRVWRVLARVSSVPRITSLPLRL